MGLVHAMRSNGPLPQVGLVLHPHAFAELSQTWIYLLYYLERSRALFQHVIFIHFIWLAALYLSNRNGQQGVYLRLVCLCKLPFGRILTAWSILIQDTGYKMPAHGNGRTPSIVATICSSHADFPFGPFGLIGLIHWHLLNGKFAGLRRTLLLAPAPQLGDSNTRPAR